MPLRLAAATSAVPYTITTKATGLIETVGHARPAGTGSRSGEGRLARPRPDRSRRCRGKVWESVAVSESSVVAAQASRRARGGTRGAARATRSRFRARHRAPSNGHPLRARHGSGSRPTSRRSPALVIPTERGARATRRSGRRGRAKRQHTFSPPAPSMLTQNVPATCTRGQVADVRATKNPTSAAPSDTEPKLPTVNPTGAIHECGDDGHASGIRRSCSAQRLSQPMRRVQ
jgi:hypothetical protein